jgi:hypothetical protein
LPKGGEEGSTTHPVWNENWLTISLPETDKRKRAIQSNPIRTDLCAPKSRF